MQEYCISDVDILLQACWKFRQLLKSQTGQECQIEDLENMITKTIRKNAVYCFSFLTIASVCMGIFRAKFLTETWSVLIKDKCKENCKHDRNCVCEWVEGRKLDASSPLEILWEGKWEPRSKFNIHMCMSLEKGRFVTENIAGVTPLCLCCILECQYICYSLPCSLSLSLI